MSEIRDAVRKAGGIVHSDGNIFFTNETQLMAVIAELAFNGTVVQAAERERCAQVAEGHGSSQIATAIRAAGDKPATGQNEAW